jgi:hypothetical protein
MMLALQYQFAWCSHQLEQIQLELEFIANYRWVGPVSKELQDITWPEELLVAKFKTSISGGTSRPMPPMILMEA